MDDFNQFSSMRFARTQPSEWREIPFAGDRGAWGIVWKGIGIALFWVALLALSLWSISQGMPK